jgi:hypothetical protein
MPVRERQEVQTVPRCKSRPMKATKIVCRFNLFSLRNDSLNAQSNLSVQILLQD